MNQENQRPTDAVGRNTREQQAVARNQPKVDEGRRSRDLYDRLKEDIEKSRAMYDKRYAESAVASADYFTQELIRILADNDATLMGPSFSR